jgi:hypothetical protein
MQCHNAHTQTVAAVKAKRQEALNEEAAPAPVLHESVRQPPGTPLDGRATRASFNADHSAAGVLCHVQWARDLTPHALDASDVYGDVRADAAASTSSRRRRRRVSAVREQQPAAVVRARECMHACV